MEIKIDKEIGREDIAAAEQVLKDNGIEADEAATVLRALGYVLLDTELYPKETEGEKRYVAVVVMGSEAVEGLISYLERGEPVPSLEDLETITGGKVGTDIVVRSFDTENEMLAYREGADGVNHGGIRPHGDAQWRAYNQGRDDRDGWMETYALNLGSDEASFTQEDALEYEHLCEHYCC